MWPIIYALGEKWGFVYVSGVFHVHDFMWFLIRIGELFFSRTKALL